ncbi:MAG: DUF3772 domain-containing protein [Pelagimonas sp.]|uniref:DUF3772 domain-containing protein n=1 Tax=Pelagimonas sp. TaxID=2073170 RepID=UPI003D6C21FC
MTGLFRCCLAGLFALVLSLSPAWSQEEGLDYVAWEALSSQIEADLEANVATDEKLENTRILIAEWRDLFLKAQSGNDARISTVQSQLDALGAAPQDGVSEVPEITERREKLLEQLARLMAPVKQAEEAYTHANGIISEIDSTIRNRQASAFLSLGPSPLNPNHWAPALTDLRNSVVLSLDEAKRKWSSPFLRKRAQANLPVVLGLAALGIMLLLRGRKWARAASKTLSSRSIHGRKVIRFLISLGQILLPMAGVYLLTQAVLALGLAGPRWTLFWENVPLWAAAMLGIHWLAEQAFHDDDTIAVMPLHKDDRKRARWISDVLAILFVARGFMEIVTEFDQYTPETLAVIEFPVLILTAYFLYLLGRVRNEAAFAGTAAARGADAGVYKLRLARLLGRAAIIIGIVGPILAAIGYSNVAIAMVYPAVATLALIGTIFVLQAFISDLTAYISGIGEDEPEGLFPVLAGVVLSIISLPALALIWGTRIADLTELWARFQEGFRIGDTRVSPSDFLVVIIVFVLGYMLTRLIQGAMRSSVLPRTKIDQGGQNAIVSGIGYIGIFAAALIAITMGGLDLSSLAIVAGALSVGIGFGLQNIVSNFVSGIILLIERPISEGDWIEVNGVHGTVRDISVRSTRIETFDRFDMIVPNADLVSGTVSNYTRGNVLGRLIVPVGVAYGTDTRVVEKILLTIARDHEMVLMNPAPYVVFRGFGADSMDFEIRVILRDVNKGLGVRTEINHQIVERFTEEGIEIPFAQRDIWLRNPEALRGGGIGGDSSGDEDTQS